MLAAVVALSTSALQAQTLLAGQVPFDFVVSQSRMPAGAYQVSAISEQLDLLRNAETHDASFLIKAIRIQSASDHGPMLVFHRYGNQYFLSEIWDGRSDSGIKLQESKREKEVRLASDRSHDDAETIVIAMNRQ
jgi:hypothetical protein